MVNFGCHRYVVNCYNEEYFWKKKKKLNADITN